MHVREKLPLAIGDGPITLLYPQWESASHAPTLVANALAGLQISTNVEGDKPARAKFKAYPIGYFHVDLAEVRTEQGRLCLLVAIDRTSKFAFVEPHEKATRRIAADFLRHLAASVPNGIHTVLTDNGTHFTDPTGDGLTPEDIKTMRAQKLPFLCHASEAPARISTSSTA